MRGDERSGAGGPGRAEPVVVVDEGDPLSTWLASLLVDEAARSRARLRRLEQQAEEEGTLAGVLADLGEREAPVVVHTDLGRRHRGRVVALGADFVALRSAAGVVLVRLASVEAVRTAPGEAASRGDRAVRTGHTLVEALAGMAGERPRVTVALAGGDSLVGDLRAVGRDVLTVRLDGGAGSAYASASAAEVSLDASG